MITANRKSTYTFTAMKRHLIQPRELYGPPDRQDELLYCWERNDALFDIITVLGGRPTFTQLFDLCEPGCINVIANSDIYFDHTLPTDMDPRHVYALSRWDGDTPYHRPDSQDAWIVAGGPHRVEADFSMGVPGCDNALAHILHIAGYTVTNPCRTIKATHLHDSGHRSYLVEGRKVVRIQPPYKLVQPE